MGLDESHTVVQAILRGMPEGDRQDLMEVTLYGVRGSVPAPPRGDEVERQIARALHRASEAGVRFASEDEARAWLRRDVEFHERSSFGGDTTCILLRCGGDRIVIDAGSGIRRLGDDLMPELRSTRRLELDFLFTHVHLDHVIGLPFFAPLFAPKSQFDVRLNMYGGMCWQGEFQKVLASTLSPPLFPVNLDQLRAEAADVRYHTIHEQSRVKLGSEGEIRATCRRLHHPNECYGWRIEYQGRVFVVATDTEPYAGPDPVLLELCRGADVVYMDSQYDEGQYHGDYDGLPRLGWGHGTAEWCGRNAREAGIRLAVSGHHDPAADGRRIHELAEKMRREFPNTVAGFDGLSLRIEDEAIVVPGIGPGGRDFIVPRSAD